VSGCVGMGPVRCFARGPMVLLRRLCVEQQVVEIVGVITYVIPSSA